MLLKFIQFWNGRIISKYGKDFISNYIYIADELYNLKI